MKLSSVRLAAIASLLSAVLASSGPAIAEQLDALLQQQGLQRGIIAQLGCTDAQQCIELHGEGRYVVHALDRDPEKVEATRRAIESQGCYGPVSARLLQGESLPFADNLINMLVVEDPLGVSEEEMMRVVRPLGITRIRTGDTWKNRVKPWPAQMDEWTHFLHSASGNAVSKDTQVGPPRRLKWSSGPKWGRSHEMNNSFAASVTAHGRLFYVFDHGLTGMEDPRLPERWTLTARDAFNGVLLWERPLPTWGSEIWKNRALRFFGGSIARRLVADKDKLFVTFEFGGPVQILDAATGETLANIPATEGAAEILVFGNHLFVTSQLDQTRRGLAAKLTCYDIAGEEVLWQAEDKAFVPQLLCAGSNAVIYHNRTNVVCLNSADGTVRWKFADKPAGGKGGSRMLLVADDKAVLSSRQQVVALNIADGEIAWQAPGVKGNSMREYDLFFAQGKLWCSGEGNSVVAHDLRTGEETARLSAASVQSEGHHLRCYRAKATENFLITQYRGVEFLDLNEQKHKNHDWMRGTCTFGVMPGNGLLYVPPHSCLCYAAAMFPGLNAFLGEAPDALDPKVGPLEKGPAFGQVTHYATDPAKSWNTYRHDGRRTGASADAIAGTLERKWKISVGTQLTPPVAAAGRLYVASKNEHSVIALDAAEGKQIWTFACDARVDSPPSICGGQLLFGSADGFVYSVRTDDGQLIWRRRLAPAERWIVVDGQLESAWPLHGSVLIEGNLAYCCAGRSTFLDGGLFLYAVDIHTGEIKHRTQAGTTADTRVDHTDDEFVAAYHIEGGNSDILVAQGGFIYLNQMKFSPDLKLQPTRYLSKEEITRRPSMNLDNKDFVNEDIFNVQWRGEDWSTYDRLAGILVDENQNVGEHDLGLHLFTTSGFLDTTYFNRSFWMYSKTWTGFNHSNLAPKSGQLVVVGPEATYALKAYTSRYALSPKLDPQTKGYLLIADDNDNDPTMDPRAWGKDKGMGFSRGAPPLWHQWLPVRVTAMVLAGDTLAVCGPPDVVRDRDPMASFEGRLGSELWTVSATDGKTIAKQELEESPIFDGMIVADNHLYFCTQDGEIICMKPSRP